MKAGHAGRLPKEDTSTYFRTACVQYMGIEKLATDNTDFVNTNIKHEKKQNVFYVSLCKHFFVFLICY
jgi:hypothetical protein